MSHHELDDPPGPPPDRPAGGPGPPASPEAACRAHAARVYAVAVRMLGSVADAEDVTREALPQIVRRLDASPGEAALPAWLYRVTVNAVLALRRKRGDDLGRAAPAPGPDDGPGAGGPAAPDRLERAVAALPPVYRDPFVLADVEGLPEAEVAALLGLGRAAVRGRLHRARLLLRAALRGGAEA